MFRGGYRRMAKAPRSSRRLQHRFERAARLELAEDLREVRGLGVDAQHLG